MTVPGALLCLAGGVSRDPAPSPDVTARGLPACPTRTLACDSAANHLVTAGPVISTFSGVGLLDRAFEDEGYVVLRCPELIIGGDIRRQRAMSGFAWGVIGGSPCQDYSSARRCDPTGYGDQMIAEFVRIVEGFNPCWWMLENVDAVPDVKIPGYTWQRVPVEAAWWGSVRRLRHIQYGSRDGSCLHVEPGRVPEHTEPCVMANDPRSFAELVRLQGLPDDFALPAFTLEEAKRAVGNGVPYGMGRALAVAIKRAHGIDVDPFTTRFDAIARRCRCTCGMPVYGNAVYYSASCRKRVQRRRDRGPSLHVTSRGSTP